MPTRISASSHSILLNGLTPPLKEETISKKTRKNKCKKLCRSISPAFSSFPWFPSTRDLFFFYLAPVHSSHFFLLSSTYRPPVCSIIIPELLSSLYSSSPSLQYLSPETSHLPALRSSFASSHHSTYLIAFNSLSLLISPYS